MNFYKLLYWNGIYPLNENLIEIHQLIHGFFIFEHIEHIDNLGLTLYGDKVINETKNTI